MSVGDISAYVAAAAYVGLHCKTHGSIISGDDRRKTRVEAVNEGAVPNTAEMGIGGSREEAEFGRERCFQPPSTELHRLVAAELAAMPRPGLKALSDTRTDTDPLYYSAHRLYCLQTGFCHSTKTSGLSTPRSTAPWVLSSFTHVEIIVACELSHRHWQVPR